MKTYCKPKTTNIESVNFNRAAVHDAFNGKLKRADWCMLLVRTGKITHEELKYERSNAEYIKTCEAVDAVAQMVTDKIRERSLSLKPVRQFKRVDGISQKLRALCQESPEQQIYEYIAVRALMPLFRAKLLPCQFGSIPNRGQKAGKRQIERILRRKFHCDDVSAVKTDVHHAYPSTTTKCVMMLLRRDIHKNKPLLWMVGAVMENYPGGVLIIGGYLSTWLFNYVMSYVLRYLMSCGAVRRGKRQRFVLAITNYADDTTIYGRPSQLLRAMKATVRWAKKTLGLDIKPAWQVVHFASLREEKDNHAARCAGCLRRTPGLDMMGYVVRRTYTIVRGKIFIRIRRQFLRARQELNSMGYVPYWRARRLTAYYGWIKNSNSRGFVRRYNVDCIMRAARLSVSRRERRMYYVHRINLYNEAERG